MSRREKESGESEPSCFFCKYSEMEEDNLMSCTFTNQVVYMSDGYYTTGPCSLYRYYRVFPRKKEDEDPLPFEL